MGWWHHGWDFGMGGWGSFLIGGLVMIVFWGGLIALVFFAVRSATGGAGRRSDSAPTDEALRTLGERYAKGEIDAEQYREMKKTLRA